MTYYVLLNQWYKKHQSMVLIVKKILRADSQWDELKLSNHFDMLRWFLWLHLSK